MCTHIRPHASAQSCDVALLAQVVALSRHDAVNADRLAFKRINKSAGGVRGVEDGRDVDVVTPQLLRDGESLQNARSSPPTADGATTCITRMAKTFSGHAAMHHKMRAARDPRDAARSRTRVGRSCDAAGVRRTILGRCKHST